MQEQIHNNSERSVDKAESYGEKKRSSNFPINSFLKSTGTVKIDFRVSSVVSLEITKEAVSIITTGKKYVQFC